MKINTEKELEKAFNDGFKAVRQAGLLQGAIAISKVVLDKANNKNKTSEERLKDIIEFCEISLRNKKT